MLQQDNADDYVLATGETHTVQEFVDLAFKELGMELQWSGEGRDKKGIEKKTEEVKVEVNPKYFRPTEVELLIGNPTKAKEKLEWEAKVDLPELVAKMVKSDLL